MENKKDIGKAISDKLGSLDKSPREQVWGGINEELQKRKKKRRIGFFFFWGKTLGILLIGTIAAFYIYNQQSVLDLAVPNGTNETITGSDGKTGKINSNNKNTEIKDSESGLNNGIATDGKNAGNNDEVTTNGNDNSNNIKNSLNPKNGNSINKSISNKAGNTVIPSATNGKAAGIKSSSSKSTKAASTLASRSKSKKQKGKIANYPKGSLKQEPEGKSKREKEELLLKVSYRDPKDGTKVDLSSLKGKAAIEIASEAKEKAKKKDSIAKKDKDKEITINMYPKDSIQKDSAKTYKKFYVDAFVSPTMYGTFSSGSMLDGTLDSLHKKSEMKFSYGFGLTYDLTDRLSIRIGYQKVNISYVTKNAYFTSSETQEINNYQGISYNPNISNQTIYNSFESPAGSPKMDITQKFSYTEIPLEIKYNFLTKKLMLKSSVGFSYWMLDENKVSIKTMNGFSQDIGKTKNVSSTAFSVNLGLELEYPLFKNTTIFMEPMFNYLAKASSTGGYQPYVFGIHTGLRYGFNK